MQNKKQEARSTGFYVKIGSISKGIATFQIEKTTHGSHFLAIKIKGWFIFIEIKNFPIVILDRYYLNGNRSITEHKTFPIGHTRLWYDRGSKKEILEGRGHPLTEELDIMLLILNNDLIKVNYTYWDLINSTKINETKIRNNYYLWKFEKDTNADCFCTTRQPYCTLNSYQDEIIVVSDELCDQKTKPRPIKCHTNNCSIQVPSAPRWQIGSWRLCEGRCWPQEAIQRRSLLCVRTISNNRTHTIPTSICIHWLRSIPITIRECPQNNSLTIPKCSSMKTYHQWSAGEWIGVSVNCDIV